MLSEFLSEQQFVEVCFKYHQTGLILRWLHLPTPEFLMHLKAPVLKSFAWTKNGVTFTNRLYSCAAGVRQRSLSWPGSAEYSQEKQSLFHWILVSEVKVKGSYFINSVSHSPEMDALFCAG